MKKLSILILAGGLLAAGCNESSQLPEDVVKAPSREGSIETSIEIRPGDSTALTPYELMVTKHTVWKNGQTIKTIERVDTLPSLGKTIEEVEDANGNVQQKLAPKEYEVYITVK